MRVVSVSGFLCILTFYIYIYFTYSYYGYATKCWIKFRLNNNTWFRNKRTNDYYRNYNIINIGQNTKKSPRDLRRPAVTQTLAKASWKNSLMSNIITESLLIAAQNNAIRTNQIKVRTDKTQHNSKCRLCGDGDKTINHIITQCSKFTQKEYKSRYDCGTRSSTRCAKNLNLTKRTNDICTTQHVSWKRTHTKSFGSLIYKWIT